MIRRVTGIYYSPVGGTAIMTERLARRIGKLLSDSSSEEISVECCDLLRDDLSGMTIDDETIVVIGMPVYVGKIPLPAIKAIEQISGNGAMAVAAVSYGSRSYGNALFELKTIAEDLGFKLVGAGAFLISYMAIRGSSNSMNPSLDLDSMGDFSRAVSDKIKRLSGTEIEEFRMKPAPVEVNGRMPVHKISRLSPRAAEIAQKVFERISLVRRSSEWFL